MTSLDSIQTISLSIPHPLSLSKSGQKNENCLDKPKKVVNVALRAIDTLTRFVFITQSELENAINVVGYSNHVLQGFSYASVDKPTRKLEPNFKKNNIVLGIAASVLCINIIAGVYRVASNVVETVVRFFAMIVLALPLPGCTKERAVANRAALKESAYLIGKGAFQAVPFIGLVTGHFYERGMDLASKGISFVGEKISNCLDCSGASNYQGGQYY